MKMGIFESQNPHQTYIAILNLETFLPEKL